MQFQHKTTVGLPTMNVRPGGLRPSLPLAVRLHADTRSQGRGVTIVMIDSDAVSHPDICQPRERVKAYVNAVDNSVGPLPVTPPVSRQWHGTMTACTAAGNGFLSLGEFTSLAPEADLILIRTMDDRGRIPTSVIVRALTWVLDNAEEYNIRIVNLSVYADELDQTTNHPVNRLVEDVIAAGIIVVAAAGNNPLAPIRPPASSPSAITVGGLDDRNSLDDSDNDLYHSTFGITALGVQKPDVIAPAIWLPAPILPGTDVHTEAAALCALDAMTDDMLLTTAPRLLPSTKLPIALRTSRNVDELRTKIAERLMSESIVSPFYKMVDGTSFAAPIVASIIAQMLEIAPDLSPADVKHILVSTAVRLPGHSPLRQGAGVVQQRLALDMARRRGGSTGRITA